MREFRFIGCTKWKRNEVKFMNKTELAKLISNKMLFLQKQEKKRWTWSLMQSQRD